MTPEERRENEDAFMHELRRKSLIRLILALPVFALSLTGFSYALFRMITTAVSDVKTVLYFFLLLATVMLLGIFGQMFIDAINDLRQVREHFRNNQSGAPDDRGHFIAEAKKHAFPEYSRTLLTPEFIMASGQYQTRLPLKDITALEIVPQYASRSFLLLKAYTAMRGQEPLLYQIGFCEHEDPNIPDHARLRESALQITEFFHTHAPECKIISPYIETPQMMQTC